MGLRLPQQSIDQLLLELGRFLDIHSVPRVFKPHDLLVRHLELLEIVEHRSRGRKG